MNTAQLVNLILEKLRRVEFLDIETRPKIAIEFRWGGNVFLAVVEKMFDNAITVYRCSEDREVFDIYTERVEGILNGKVRNEDGELV
jgi:hypothetical protein